MLRLACVVGGGLACSMLSACGAVSQEDIDASVSPDGAPGATFSLSLAPARLLLRQGGSGAVDVTPARPGTTPPAVTISPTGLPAGVTAAPLVIDGTSSTGKLVLSASSSAVQAGPLAVEITGSAGATSEHAPLELLVGGAAGTLDLSFASAGKFKTQVGSGSTVGRGVFVQPDGKIVATGATGTGQALTVRLGATGVPDPTFGESGVVSTGVGNSSGGIHIVGLDSGELVVGGWGGDINIPDLDFTLFAYTAQGNLDTSFGTAGGTVSSDPGPGFGEVHTLLHGSSGLVAVGTLFSANGAGTTANIFRYSDQGQPESGFAINEAGASAEAAILQSDGKILVGGGKNSNFWIVRYLGSARDMAWNGSGEVVTDFGGFDLLSGLAQLASGKLLAAGSSAPAGATAVLALARYNPNGSLDLTFGSNGKVVTTLAIDSRSPNAMAVDAEGRILYVGFQAGHLFAVVRLLPTGAPDTSFASGGVANIDFAAGTGGNQSGPYGVAIDADGRIVVSGQAGPDSSASLVVARLWP